MVHRERQGNKSDAAGGKWHAGAATVKIRASWIVAPSDWTPLLPEKTGSPEAPGVQYRRPALAHPDWVI
jgi:hypothetical protein